MVNTIVSTDHLVADCMQYHSIHSLCYQKYHYMWTISQNLTWFFCSSDSSKHMYQSINSENREAGNSGWVNKVCMAINSHFIATDTVYKVIERKRKVAQWYGRRLITPLCVLTMAQLLMDFLFCLQWSGLCYSVRTFYPLQDWYYSICGNIRCVDWCFVSQCVIQFMICSHVYTYDITLSLASMWKNIILDCLRASLWVDCVHILMNIFMLYLLLFSTHCILYHTVIQSSCSVPGCTLHTYNLVVCLENDLDI